MPAVVVESGLSQNAVWVLDFALTFPLVGAGAIWLWKRRPWGYIVGGMMLIMLTIESASVAIDQLFGHLHSRRRGRHEEARSFLLCPTKIPEYPALLTALGVRGA
jgi:hypothetical protein